MPNPNFGEEFGEENDARAAKLFFCRKGQIDEVSKDDIQGQVKFVEGLFGVVA
jgi:hypothetical protein